jgi:hypothetical protein
VDFMPGYVLDEVVGRGRAGTVWRAHPEHQPRRTVAIKRVPAADADRLRAEADVLADLDHPHIVRVFDIAGDALIMQYAAGGSLADLLAERQRLLPGEVVAVAAPIADALASAHGRGVVHGDVRPENILFTSEGQPLLGDFGSTDSRLDYRSDICALGVVCARALGDGQAVPPALGRVIETATAADPARRFVRAGELAAALRAAVDHADIRLPGPARSRRPGRAEPTRDFGPRPPRPAPEPVRSGRARVLLAVAAAVALASLAGLAGGGMWWATGGDPDPRAGASCPEPDSGTRPPLPVGAHPLEGDTDGDACVETGHWFVDPAGNPSLVVVVEVTDGAVATSFGVGRPGDVPMLGDWDCDGRDTLAVYRPQFGEIYRYDAWPRTGALERPAETGHPVDARPYVVTTDGCDRLAFESEESSD